MVTINVIYKSGGRPANYEKVHIAFGDSFMGSYLEVRTDSNGDAHFDISPRTGEVFVSGSKRFSGHLCGRVVIYI